MSINAFTPQKIPINPYAGTVTLPDISSTSPFSRFALAPTPPPPVSQKTKNTEFCKGFGKGFLTVLSMPWHGALMTLGIAGVGIVFPWAVPFITLGVGAIALYQGAQAIKNEDWQKMGQSLFALLSPLMGGAWIRKTFAADCRKIAVFALKNASAPKNPSKNMIFRWLQDSKASFDDTLRLLRREKLYPLAGDQKPRTLYQIAPRHFADFARLGFLRGVAGTEEKPQLKGWDRLLPPQYRPVLLEMLSVALTPGGPPNGFGMELTQSDLEQDIEKRKQEVKDQALDEHRQEN